MVVTHRQHIDETNEEVQALVDAGVGTVERCIRAIKMYETAETAIRHMDEPEEEGEEGEGEALSPGRSLPMLSEQHEVPSDVNLSFIAYVSLLNYDKRHYNVCCSAEEIIISFKEVEDKYLRLDELGTVLHQLSQNFPGTYCTYTLYVLYSSVKVKIRRDH